jgi:hypothetical protein
VLEEHLEEDNELDPLDSDQEFDNPRLRYRYTLKQKIEAIELAEQVGNRQAEKQLSIGESCIRKWRSQKAEILSEVDLERNRLKRKKPDDYVVLSIEYEEIKKEDKIIAHEMFERKKEFRPRKSYTSALKLEAVKYAEEVGNRQAAKYYNMDESCIRKWRSQKELLIKIKQERNTKRIPNLKFPDIEVRLKEFVEQRKKEGILLRPNEIRMESIKIAKELNVENFKGTSSYIFKFMERYQIQSRRTAKLDQ